MASTFRSGEPSEPEGVDPFGNAIRLAEVAEARAKKNKNVDDMLAASTQWLAIAQIHKQLTEGMGDEPPRQVGFTGGNNE